MMVEATQCSKAETIATDLGFIHVNRDEWIVRGEGGECYVVDDAFFRRTFVSAREQSCGPELQASQADSPGGVNHQITSRRIASRRCFRQHRAPRAFRRRLLLS
jgi:hypothetical protein